MAETVKTIENVDRLFSQIIVNGEVHESSNYVPPVEPQQTVPVVPEPQEQPSQNENQGEQQSTQGEDVYAVELNDVLHNFVDQAVTQGLAEEVTARETADTGLDERLDAVEEVIPSSATSSNKLVDQASVDTIATDAVNAVIETLDVAQSGGNGKYIKAISETDGKISATEGTIDSSVSSGSSNPVTGGAVDTAITNAVNALDVAQSGGDGKYIKAISEADGKISATEGTIDSNVAEGSSNPVTSGAVQSALALINALIPAQASAENQLADKNFVNSSIASNTANFIGTFESVTELRSYTGTVTNNDYAFVRNTVVQYNGGDFPNVTALNNYDKTLLTNGDYAWVVNTEDNTKFDLYRFDIVEQAWLLRATKIDKSLDVLNAVFNRYKATVSGSTVTWAYEYTLNNSSFTAEQWATINSGLTSTSISDAINALDVAQSGGNGKYIKAISEADGKISATEGTIDSSVTSGSSNPVTGGAVYTGLDGKVDKVNGKGLSTNDFTDTLKNKLDGIEAGAQVNSVTGVKGNSESTYRTGDVNITKSNIGLGNVANTGDSATPVSGGTTKFTTGGAYNLLLNLASAFDTATDYTVGSYVIYNGSLYKCIANHTAGAWDSTHFTVVNVGDEIEQLNEVMASLPTDAVLHYSFDEVPDYPDGNADARFLNGNTYGLQSTNYQFRINNNDATITNDNGLVKIAMTSRGSYGGVFIPSTYAYQKVIKLRIKVTDLNVGKLHIFYGSTNVIDITEIGTYEISTYVATNNGLYFDGGGNANSCTFTIEQIYIGNGSYATSIIDNANGQNNAINNGGIAIQGLSGKGLYGIGKRTILMNSTFPKPTDKSSITLSGWVKYFSNYDDTGTRNLFGTGAYNGSFCIFHSWSTAYNSMRLTAFVRGASSSLQKSIGVSVTKNEWHNFAMVWENKTLTFYVDGIKYITTALDVSDYTFGSTDWRIGDTGVVQGTEPSSAGTIEYTVDDVLIFNRALSEQEVLALYFNKANTPKYYDINNYAIDSADATPTADSKNLVLSGGVASALSGKQNTLTFDNNSTYGSNNPVKSNGLFAEKYAYAKSSQKDTAGWYKIISCSRRNMGDSLKIELMSNYNATPSSAHSVQIEYGWLGINIFDMANDSYNVFDKIRYCYNKNNNDEKAIYVHYSRNNPNGISFNVSGGTMLASTVTLHNFVTDEITWEETIEYNLGTSGLYVNGEKIDLSQYLRGNLGSTQTEIYTGNLNDVQYGNYFVSSSATNLPPQENSAGFLTSLFRSISYQEQIMFFPYTRNIYHRVRYNGTWSNWQSLQSTFIGKYSYTRDTALSSTIYLKIYERAGVSAVSYGSPVHLFGDCGLISSYNKTPFDITIDFRIPDSIGLIYGHVSSNLQAYIDIIPTWDNDTNTARIYVAIKARYAYIRLQSTVTLLSPTEDSAMLGTAGSSMFDRATKLRTLQNQTLSTPITIEGAQQTTVEGALGALASASGDNSPVGTIIRKCGALPADYINCGKGEVTKFNQVSGAPTSIGFYSLLQTFNGTVYAGTSDGLYKSIDGTTFTQVSGIPVNAIIYSLLQTTDNTIYAGTGDGLYKSTDGSTFSQVSGAPSGVAFYTLLQTTDGTIYAGIEVVGLYKSTDGSTFSLVSSTLRFKSLLQTADGTIYAGTYDMDGLYKSTDGTTFTKISSAMSNSTIQSLLQTTDGTIYVGTYASGLYKSTDGSTFSEDSDVFSGIVIHSLLQTADGTLYVGTANSLYKSTDGTTFTQISGAPSNVRSLLQTADSKIYAGTTSYIYKASFYKELSKTTYADLYAVVGDKYNFRAQVTDNTKFAIPLLGEDDLTYGIKAQ